MHSLPALTLELLALIQTDRPAALAIQPGAVPRIAELLRDVKALAEREDAFNAHTKNQNQGKHERTKN